MRRLITLSMLSLTLFGGVAMADNRDHRAVETHREVAVRDRREVVDHYRDHRVRPELRFERHDNRAGFRWNAGSWNWNGYEWAWTPGFYVRIRL